MWEAQQERERKERVRRWREYEAERARAARRKAEAESEARACEVNAKNQIPDKCAVDIIADKAMHHDAPDTADRANKPASISSPLQETATSPASTARTMVDHKLSS